MTFSIEHPSDVAGIVISVKRFCTDLGFTETEGSLISTAVSELATNIVRYAGEGKLVISELSNGKKDGIGIIAEDQGPGIPDVSKAIENEFSTGNSLGLGLPSVKRIMDRFEIETEQGCGTVVRTEKWKLS